MSKRTCGAVVTACSAVVVCGALAVTPASAAKGPSRPPQAKLTASATQPSQALGASVAVSGNTVVVGAPGTTVGGQADEGAVYVYTRPKAGWSNRTQQAVLTFPMEPFGPQIGFNLAVSGNTIVVGDTFASGGVYQQGAVYVFTKPKSGWASSSTPTATLTASDPSPGSFLGSSVAISGDTIVAGEHGQGPIGAAYVFVMPHDGWASQTQQAKLAESSGTSNDGFGSAVAISGGTIVVGAPAAPTGGIADSGMAYVFVKPAGGWTDTIDTTETRRLVASHPVEDAQFGSDVALSGPTAVVGSNADYRFDSTPPAGAVDVFTRPRGGWGLPTQAPLHQTAALKEKGASHSDGFGSAVAVSGSRIAAGVPMNATSGAGPGAVDLFDRPAKGWANMTQSGELVAANRKSADQFGAAVALTSSTIEAGAPGPYSTEKEEDSGAGAAYVFSVAVPKLTALKQSHSSWVLGTHKPAANPKHAPKGGTRFSFRLNEPATVTLAFAKQTGSHFGSERTVILAGRMGSNRLYVDGPLSGTAKLGVGHYRVEIKAIDAVGEKTATRTLHFRTRRR